MLFIIVYLLYFAKISNIPNFNWQFFYSIFEQSICNISSYNAFFHFVIFSFIIILLNYYYLGPYILDNLYKIRLSTNSQQIIITSFFNKNFFLNIRFFEIPILKIPIDCIFVKFETLSKLIVCYIFSASSATQIFYYGYLKIHKYLYIYILYIIMHFLFSFYTKFIKLNVNFSIYIFSHISILYTFSTK